MPRPSVAFERIALIISPYFRKKRMRKFFAAFSISPETTIIDVGGLPAFWSDLNCVARITLVNNDRPALIPSLGRFAAVAADGRCLPFKQQGFDIAFSN